MKRISLRPTLESWDPKFAERRARHLNIGAWMPGIELVVHTSTAAHYITDSEGRPLGERSVRVSAFPDVTFSERATQFEGSRSGKRINHSAMRQVGEHWKDLLDLLSFISWRSREYCGVEDVSVSVVDLIGYVSTTLPIYEVRSGRQVPSLAAALYKTGQGLSMAAKTILDQVSNDDCGVRDRLDHRELFELCEQTGLFVNDDRACAGPASLIEQFLEVACNPKEPQAIPPVLEDRWSRIFSYSTIVCLAQNLTVSCSLECLLVFITTMAKLDPASRRALSEEWRDEPTPGDSLVSDMQERVGRYREHREFLGHDEGESSRRRRQYASLVRESVSAELGRQGIAEDSALGDGLTEVLAITYDCLYQLSKLADKMNDSLGFSCSVEWDSATLSSFDGFFEFGNALGVHPWVDCKGRIEFAADRFEAFSIDNEARQIVSIPPVARRVVWAGSPSQ